MRKIRQWHDLLADEAFFSVAICSGLALFLLLGRFYFTRSWDFRFMSWNLFLAWIPYVFSMGIMLWHRQNPKAIKRLLFPAVLWLLFLPNAPYMITDIIHFRIVSGFYWWYDLFLIFSFAFAGCFIAVVSLNTMHRIVGLLTNRLISWIFAFACIGLSGFGVYLGRGPGFNSWSLLTRPHHIVADVFHVLTTPGANVTAIGISVIVAAILGAWYLAYVNLRLLPPLEK